MKLELFRNVTFCVQRSALDWTLTKIRESGRYWSELVGNREILNSTRTVSVFIVFSIEVAKFRLRSRYARSECACLLRAWRRDKLGRIFPDSSSLSNALPWLGNSAKVSSTIACHSILPVTEFAFEFAGSFVRSLKPILTIGTGIERERQIEYTYIGTHVDRWMDDQNISQLVIRYRVLRIEKYCRYTKCWKTTLADLGNISKINNCFRRMFSNYKFQFDKSFTRY